MTRLMLSVITPSSKPGSTVNAALAAAAASSCSVLVMVRAPTAKPRSAGAVAEGGSAVPHAGTGARLPIARYLSLLTVITIIATFFTPETRGRNLEDPRDATHSREVLTGR